MNRETRPCSQAPAECAGHALRLSAGEVPAFVRDVLLARHRELPVVAVSTPFGGRPAIDADALAGRLTGRAQVILLETGEPTWELTNALPPRLDVYGGAVRIWWPDLNFESEPADHPLIFASQVEQAEHLVNRILRKLEVAIAPKDDSVSPRGEPIGSIVNARVESIRARNVLLQVDGVAGRLVSSDLGFDLLAEWLRPGQEISVRALATRDPDGRQHWSAQGLLLAPWPRLVSLVEHGDCITGVVRRIEGRGCMVEVLPTVQGFVPLSEIDWAFVRDVHEFVQVGEETTVQVLELDLGRKRLILSIKGAMGKPKREPLELVPRGKSFPTKTQNPSTQPDLEKSTMALEELAILDALKENLRRVVAESSRWQAQAAELKRELRSEQDRRAHLERLTGDPLRSERDFLAAVRTSYARAMDEEDRLRYPLAIMRVGGSFLASLRNLGGISLDKVIDVCAQVASGRGHEISSRQVHRLRAGPRGASFSETREDGATAWRCSLQDATASARRLHWWNIPGTAGTTIEFAQVGVHDDFGMPE